MKNLKSNSKFTNSKAPEIFANFFHSTYSVDNGKLPQLQQDGAFNLIADDIIFDVDKIKLLLNKLPNKYSAGPDGILNILLKKLSNSLCLPLSIIFQKSFNNSDLPDNWKQVDVIPVFKGKDNKYDVNNYKSINLTNTIGKVLETMIHNHITKDCEKFKLLHSVQHGFTNKPSTTSSHLELLKDFTCYINNGHSVDLITIDFSNAFDSISHNIFIYKLKSVGICGKILLRIKDF